MILLMMYNQGFTGIHSSPKERQLQKSCVSFGKECKKHSHNNNTTPTNRFWSSDFHITVVQTLAIILVIVLKQNYKMEDTPILFCLVVFTLLQRLAVFAIDHKSNGLAVIFCSIEPRSNIGGEHGHLIVE